MEAYSTSSSMLPVTVGGLAGRIVSPGEGWFVGGRVGYVRLHEGDRFVGGCVGRVSRVGPGRFVGGCVGSIELGTHHAYRGARVPDAALGSGATRWRDESLEPVAA
jgi:hypothetical protein